MKEVLKKEVLIAGHTHIQNEEGGKRKRGRVSNITLTPLCEPAMLALG